MQKKDHFILFALDEFQDWLEENHFHRAVKLVQNHHTYLPDYRSFSGSNHFRLLEGMEDYHIHNGFNEIAQNLTTFPDGTVSVCRSLDKIPAGIKGANQGGICIEHVGNFDKGKDKMTGEHRKTILGLNALLCKKFHLAPSTDTIVYHHWYDLTTGVRTNGSGNVKTCPGTTFFGGNSVRDAQKNFIPAIKELLAPHPTPVSPQVLKTGEVTASALNVRSAPDTSADILRTLARGIQVRIYEEQEGWYRIHPQEQHWVSGGYVKLVN